MVDKGAQVAMSIPPVVPTEKVRASSQGLIALLPWLMLLSGLMFLYVPTLLDLFQGLWRSDDQAHGPIVFAVSLWLLYSKWDEFRTLPEKSDALFGVLCLVVAGLIYAIGRSQEIVLFELGSLIPMLIGCALIMRGREGVKLVWFPLFFMLFMLPLPGSLVDAATQPMKMAVSYCAEWLLFTAGYPIARTGVILQIGQYQLLVADACAGIHTLFTLEAMGLLYLNLVRHSSIMRNIGLAILIVPISFASNVVRVIVLTLVTYHLGDEAGQGFLHGFAGMVLFISGLLLIMLADSMLRFGSSRIRNEKVQA